MKDGMNRGYIRSVKLIRVPTEEDRERFMTVKRADLLAWRHEMNAKNREKRQDKEGFADQMIDPELLDAEGDVDDSVVWGPGASNGMLIEAENVEVEEVSTIVPRWKPGIQAQDLMYDLIHETGIRGIGSKELTSLGYGRFWRRPLDNTLGRVTDAWEQSQPKHLQHLAIIRDTAAFAGGRTSYIYRTYPNFEKAVENEQASWDAVKLSTTKKGQPRKTTHEVEYDEWGFPIISKDKFAKQDGTATLLESNIAAKIPKGQVSVHDPSLARNDDGTMRVVWPNGAPDTPFGDNLRVFVNGPETPSGSQGGTSFGRTKGRNSSAKANQGSGGSAKRGRPPKAPTGASLALVAIQRSMKTPGLYKTDGTKYRWLMSERKWLAAQYTRQAKRLALEEAVLQKNTATAEDDNATPQPTITEPAEGASGIESQVNGRKRRRDPSDQANNSPASKRLQISSGGSILNSGVNIPASSLAQEKVKPKAAYLPWLGALVSTTNIWQTRIKKIGSNQNIAAAESRVQELVKVIADRSRQGVHLNPTDVSEALYRGGKGVKNPVRLLVVIKLKSLTRLDGFINNSGVEQTSTPETTDLAPTMSGPERAIEAASDVEGLQMNDISIDTPALDTSAVASETLVGSDIPPVISSSTRQRGSHAKAKSRGLLSLEGLPTGLYLNPKGSRYQRGRPRPNKIVAVIKSDRLKELQFLLDEACPEPTGPTQHTSTAAPSVSQPRDLNISDSVTQSPTPATRPNHPPNSDRSRESVQNVEPVNALHTLNDPQGPAVPVVNITEDTSRTFKTPVPVVSELEKDSVALPAPPSREKESVSVTDNQGLNEANAEISMADAPPLPEVQQTQLSNEIIQTQSPDENSTSELQQKPSQSTPSRELRQSSTVAADSGINNRGSLPPVVHSFELHPARTRNRKRKERERKQGVSLGEGTVGRNRSKIALQLVEMCNGVFPGKNEIITPFQQLWLEEYPGTIKPERMTVSRTIQRLIDTTKLRRIDFHFIDEKGISQIRTILMLPSVSIDSPLVKDLQEKIVDKFPEYYIPPEILHLVPAPAKRAVQGPVLPFDHSVLVERINKPLWLSQAHERRESALPKLPPQRRKSGSSGRHLPRTRLQTAARPRKDVLIRQGGNNVLAPRVYDISDNDEPSNLILSAQQDARWDFTPPYSYHLPGNLISRTGFTRRQSGAHPQSQTGRRVLRRLAPRLSGRTNVPLSATFNTLLVPVWIFHSSSGTFSSIFHGFQATELPPPNSLQEILSRSAAIVNKGDIDVANLEFIRFSEDVSRVSSWEIAAALSETSQKHSNGAFINHTLNVPHAVPDQETPMTLSWANSDQMSSMHMFHVQRQQAIEDIVPGLQPLWTVGRPVQPAAANKRRKASLDSDKQQRPKRRRNRKTRNSDYLGASELRLDEPYTPQVVRSTNVVRYEVDPTRSPESRSINEEPDVARPNISPEKTTLYWNSNFDPNCHIDSVNTTKLLVAAIVIRTLIGGLEQRMEWNIFQTLFQNFPNFNLPAFRLRWSWVQRHQKEMIDRYQIEFENKFLEAYAAGELPSLDYENPGHYDWAGVITWALRKIALPSADLDELPADRRTLTEIATVEKDPDRKGPTKINLYKETVAIKQRLELLHEYGYHAAIDEKTQPSVPRLDPESREGALQRAKSWIRANVATPVEVWNSEEAYSMIASIPKDLQDEALRQFKNNNIFADVYKGRTVPGRNYHLHEKFFTALKRPIEPVHLQQAVEFKYLLDETFVRFPDAADKAGCFFKLPYDASDGMILALTNLTAHNRVRIVAQLPEINNDFDAPQPRISKWGFESGVYKTMQMDREHIYFDLHIVPTDEYVFGNPLAVEEVEDGRKAVPKLAPLDLSNPNVMIPIWYDIHGQMITDLWTRVVASVMQIVAIRPGVGVTGIEEYFKGNLWLWELKMLIKELVHLGAIMPVSSGRSDWASYEDMEDDSWTLGEWWWMILADIPGQKAQD